MFMRIDKLQTELPTPKRADPNAAAALQELLGGKFGEMSTLNNYLFQSFNFRSKSKLRPFYSLVAAITAEELGHVELVTNGVNMLANGPDGAAEVADDSEDDLAGRVKEGLGRLASTATRDERTSGEIGDAPYAAMRDIRLTPSFFSAGRGAMPADSMGMPWTGANVVSSGNLVFDLIHNFYLECGARLHKLRVYETMTEPTGREVCGYLLVRGSVHAHAYALALKKLSGVEVEKLLPTPNIPLSKIPEAAKYLEEGSHRRLYRFSADAYQEMAGIWGGGEMALPGDPPGELEVVDGHPDGGRIPELEGVGSIFTPDYAPEELFEVASKLYKKASF